MGYTSAFPLFVKLSSFYVRFNPSDTNMVLREFEKCGGVLRSVPGPKEANWMHILYQVLFPDCFFIFIFVLITSIIL
jgi:Nup53/35/40-type RNA recognition motif